MNANIIKDNNKKLSILVNISVEEKLKKYDQILTYVRNNMFLNLLRLGNTFETILLSSLEEHEYEENYELFHVLIIDKLSFEDNKKLLKSTILNFQYNLMSKENQIVSTIYFSIVKSSGEIKDIKFI